MTDTAKKDLAEAYRLMMDSAAWKHFVVNTLDEIERQALNDFQSFAITPNTLGDLADFRGQIKAIRRIRANLAYVVEGLQ